MTNLVSIVVHAVGVYALFMLGGMGATAALLPYSLRRHALILAPLYGVSIASALGFLFYLNGFRGTDQTLPCIVALLLFPTIAWGGYQYYAAEHRRVIPTREFFCAVAVGCLVVTFVMIPFATEYAIVPISTGNNDIVNHMGKSIQAKELTYDSRQGFLGQVPPDKPVTDHYDHYDLRENRFGSPFITAFIATLCALPIHSAEVVAIALYVLLGTTVTYWASVAVFRLVNPWPAVVAAWVSLHTATLYVVYCGFEAQLLGTIYITSSIALSILFLHRESRSVSELFRYSTLVGLLLWGINISYAHALPFVLCFVVAYSVLLVPAAGSLQPVLAALKMLGVAIGLNFLVSPLRTTVFVSNLLRHGFAPLGWPMPYIYPGYIFAMASPSKTIWPILGWFLSVLVFVPVLVCYGQSGSRRSHLLLAMYINCFSFLGYNALYLTAGTELNANEYKSFKFFTYFHALQLMSLLPAFTNGLSRRAWLKRSLQAIFCLFFFISLGCGLRFVSHVTRNHIAPSRDLLDLSRIQEMPNVKSLNILLTEWWEILTANSLLLKKQQYFAKSTYAGRVAGPLLGQWDLVKSPALEQVPEPPNLFRVNATYALVWRGDEEESEVQSPYKKRFSATISTQDLRVVRAKMGRLGIKVAITNNSNFSWEPRQVNLAYRVLGKNGSFISEGGRTFLPRTILPSDEISVELEGAAPCMPGEYVVLIDLVDEGHAWFSDLGNEPLRVECCVIE